MALSAKGLANSLWKDVLHPWIWEILLCVTSSSILTSIIAILAEVDDRSQEEWGFQITLNSLINILSIIFRACLASTAAEVISQQKWIWFWSAPTPGRPIGQVQTFEEGGRSSVGALKLLPTVATQQPFAIVPIIILLTSLSVGPFAQQSIRTVYKSVPSGLGTASLATSNNMNSSGSWFRTMEHADYGVWSFNCGPRNTLFHALANPRSKDSLISPLCPTGNCNFPLLSAATGITHTSLGVCSTCTDVGELIEQRKSNSTRAGAYHLPNGMELITGNSTAWLSVSSPYYTSDMRDAQRIDLNWAKHLMTSQKSALARWAFVNTTVFTMSFANGADPIPVAAACSLYPCVRSYAARVQNGKLSERVLDSTPLVPEYKDHDGYSPETLRRKDLVTSVLKYSLAAIQPSCVINGEIYSRANGSASPDATRIRLLAVEAAPEFPTEMANEGCVTRIDGLAYALIGGVYAKFFNGNCSWDPRNGPELICDDRLWLTQFWGRNHATVQSIIERFDAIADATTNQIRLGFLRTPGTPDRVDGWALRRVAYTRIVWEWLIVPGCLLALDIAMLIYMIVHSARHRDTEAVWKSNLLPLIYYKSRFVGPGEPDQRFLSADFDPLESSNSDRQEKLLTTADLEAVAKTVKVKFLK
ncbi:hypothetical protein PG990_006756 [Apiospora arundinis]|uniref:Uncharacterized protein n=1 Tax=Apiospora arundinis TaxID=335852 RepID=A0ABR2JB13_9PEZI